MSILIVFIIIFEYWRIPPQATVDHGPVSPEVRSWWCLKGLGYIGETTAEITTKTPPPPFPEPWRRSKPEPDPSSNAGFSFPSEGFDYYLLSGCFLICMSFYNLFLRFGGYAWSQWRKCATKLVIPTTLDSNIEFTTTDSYDRDNPVKPLHRVRVRTNHKRSMTNKRLLAAFALFGSAGALSTTFQLSSEVRLRQNLRSYRGLNGNLNTSKLPLAGLNALDFHIRASNDSFSTAIGSKSSCAFSAIADSGCSKTCTNCILDFIPGSLETLDEPIALGGIAGNLQIQQIGRVHWETIDAYGEVFTIETNALYHPDLPGRLFSPQAYLEEQSVLQQRAVDPDDHFKVKYNCAEWHMDGQLLFTMNYDQSFLPRLTLFHQGKATTTLLSMQSELHESNHNLSALDKIWMKWHVKLGHLSFAHVRKLAHGGFLDVLSMAIPVKKRPHCAACCYGKQTRTPDGSTTTTKNP